MTKLIKWLLTARNISLIAILYTLLVTVAFLLPANDILRVKIPFLDKFIHILIHTMLCCIWLWYFQVSENYRSFKKNVIIVLAVCFSYGILIEGLQHWFTKSRQFDFFDVIANGIGCIIGLLSFLLILKIYSQKINA